MQAIAAKLDCAAPECDAADHDHDPGALLPLVGLRQHARQQPTQELHAGNDVEFQGFKFFRFVVAEEGLLHAGARIADE